MISRLDAATEKPEVSTVIVSWNTSAMLENCLRSLFHCQGLAVGLGEVPRPNALPIEVIVVDNASIDSSVEMVHEQFPMVRVIQNHENVGFARANNQAFPACEGRYVLLLNPDTEVRPGAMETLVRFMDDHPDAGAAGARLVDPGGMPQNSCHPEPTLSRELWRLFHMDALYPHALYRMADWNLDTPRDVDVTQGACLILRREALEQTGLLDEDYFIYSEEVDLCHRLRDRGWRVFWVPRAVVVHHGGQSTSQVAAAMLIRLYQGKILFFRKHYGRSTARFYKLILLAATIARLLISPLALLEHAPERHRHLTLARQYTKFISALLRL